MGRLQFKFGVNYASINQFWWGQREKAKRRVEKGFSTLNNARRNFSLGSRTKSELTEH